MRYSLEGKLTFLAIGLALVTAALVALIANWTSSYVLGFIVGLGIAALFAIALARYFMAPVARTIQAVSDGIVSMRDHDFSVSISPSSAKELSSLVSSYNGLGDLLRDERQSLYQRELLLDTVIQATPLAMVLTN